MLFLYIPVYTMTQLLNLSLMIALILKLKFPFLCLLFKNLFSFAFLITVLFLMVFFTVSKGERLWYPLCPSESQSQPFRKQKMKLIVIYLKKNYSGNITLLIYFLQLKTVSLTTFLFFPIVFHLTYSLLQKLKQIPFFDILITKN